MSDEMQAENGKFIDDPEALGDKVLEWKKRGFHVLSPAIKVSSFAPGYGVNASLVLLDPRVDADGSGGTDVYFDKNTMDGDPAQPQEGDQRAPSKIGLMKIAAAAGVSWVDPYGRVDPLTIINLWIYRVTGVYLAYDGTPQVIKGEKEIDYRDGSAQVGEWSREAWRDLEARNRALPKGQKAEWSINGWSEKRVRQARTNGAERAETGALERAIRTLGIAHVYTIAELRQPFVALRVCPMVDMTDPEVRRAVMVGQLGGVAKLYAHVPAALGPVVDPNLRPFTAPPRQGAVEVARAAPAPAASVAAAPPPPVQAAPPTTEARPATPAQMEPPDDGGGTVPLPAGAVFIRSVKQQQLKYSQPREGRETFTKWTVVDSNGEESETVFAKWGNAVDKAHAAAQPVFLQTAEKTYQGRVTLEIVNVREAGAGTRRAEEEPPLPMEPADMKL